MNPCRSCIGRLPTGGRRCSRTPGTGLLAAVGLATISLVLIAGAAAAQEDELAPQPALIAPLAERSLLLDVAIAGTRLVAVGDRGHILLSDDDGVTWRQVPSPVCTGLTAVHFSGELLGWAVGHDAAILRTSDAGESWELVHWAPEDESPLFDVWFADETHGFALGAYGAFYATADGGSSWEPRTVAETDVHLHHLARADNGSLTIAAEAGTVFRSDDEGETWRELPSPYEGSFFGSLPLRDGGLLLFGLRGHAFRSDDGGESWRELFTGTQAMLNAAVETRDGRVVVVGLVGTVLVSSDGGRSFTLRARPDRRGISSVVQTPAGTLVAVGEGGVSRLSLDTPTTVGSAGGGR